MQTFRSTTRSTLRARWAAVGAAVAVTLGAGGLATVSATSPADAVTFVPITPCRLFDTRPAYQVGPRATPLGAGETMTVTATGSTGNCTNIPDEATGVSLNVTADVPSQLTFLTIWPTGATMPNASSLNPAPGPPVPNAVTTELNSDGEFSIFNELGTVHVLADLNGYYIDHHHDDRYYTKDEVDQRAPKEMVISVGAADFVPRFPDTTLQRGMTSGGVFQAGGANGGIIAGVHLPDGATITRVTARYRDSIVAENLDIALLCENDNGFGAVFEADITAPVTSVPGATVVLDPGSVSPVVDNTACLYRVSVFNDNWAAVTSNLIFKSMLITVEMPA